MTSENFFDSLNEEQKLKVEQKVKEILNKTPGESTILEIKELQESVAKSIYRILHD